jgi:hypothetical protein
MNSAPRSESLTDESIAHRSLGTLAAALATCTHPKSRHVVVPLGRPAERHDETWCAACGALRVDGSAVVWKTPALAAQLTRKPFEELVLVLHAVVQLTQVAGDPASPEASGAPASPVLRRLRASLAALARLPAVRDVDRLEQAIARMQPLVHP